MALRQVQAERYIGPLREGGSLPLLVRAEDGERYVVKMRGAGQGPLALVAEVIAGELLRRLELPVPDLVLVDIDGLFGRQEPDAEVRDLLRASTGLNVGLRFLEAATTFDLAAGDRAPEEMASRVVWGDAFLMNVDRTPRNPNLLQQGRKCWLIDHGAALYIQHDWSTAEGKVRSPFAPIAHHVLLPWATQVEAAGAWASQRLTAEVIGEVVELVPGVWFSEDAGPDRYERFLTERLNARWIFEAEVERARAGRL